MRLKHPLSRADYFHNEDGTVTVSGRSGVAGIFDRKGNWLSGELRIADPLMCMVVADGFQNNPGAGHAVLEANLNVVLKADAVAKLISKEAAR